MRRITLILACALAHSAAAQDVTVRDGGDRPSAAILRDALAKPHIVRTGSGRLDLPRDSTISATLIVIGRPTYLAGRVQGDVVVVGSDLFLRPGVDISGRAVAIGGTVSLTTLGRVAGGTESFRDETYVATVESGRQTLSYRVIGKRDPIPVLQLAGIQGLLIPTYDRVNGLSLPVGALITLGDGAIEIEPSVSYRSARGVFDPAVDVRANQEGPVHFAGRAGIDTRSNEKWIYGDLLNSGSTFWSGSDLRNYFESRGGVGRAFWRMERTGRLLEPFVGARYERVSALHTRSVFSVLNRNDIEHVARPNPLVESGNIGSALAGAQLYDTSGFITSRLRAEVEQSFTTVAGTSNFTQLTLDGRVAFPTFGTQRLDIRAHGVATAGDRVPRARYAYLGHGGTLPLLDDLEQGGTELIFVESRYFIPVPAIVLPMVGSPTLMLRHIIGAAGVSLPTLEQEVGIGVGVSFLRLDVTTDAARKRGTKVGFGVSLSKY